MSCLYLFLITSCSKKILPEKMPETQIIFGSGGGFTNQVKEYCLLENGKIVAKSADGTYFDILTHIGKTEAKQCFNKCQSLHLDEMQFNEPGNLYYFLTIRTKSKPENRIVWGDRSKPVSADVAQLHKTLMSYLPKRTPQENSQQK